MKASSTVAPSSEPTNKIQQEQIQQPQPPLSITELVNSDKSSKFAVFKLNQRSSFYLIIYILLQTIFISWWAISVSVDGVPIVFKLISYSRLFMVPLLEWTYLYFARQHLHSDILTNAGKRISLLGNMIIIFQALSLGGLMLAWTLTRDDCQSDICLEEYPTQMMPLRIFINVIIISIGMPVIFPSHDVLVSFISALITGVIMFVCGVILHLSLANLLAVVTVGLTVFFISFCYEGVVFSAYTSYSKFETALRVNIASENKEYLMKIQTEEMRHMIGNVAHDLRTPLQAFQSEMEILRNNIIKNDNNKSNDDKKCLLSSMDQLDRICNFMNMTINRSIDFTKASSGIKLNPSIESINFSETMNWAVGCMVQSHAKVPIVVLPIPKSIHNQIYTDKQWLMENMMCLLSNAQKFTTEGSITIRCSIDNSLHGVVVQKLTTFDKYSVASSSSSASDHIANINTNPSTDNVIPDIEAVPWLVSNDKQKKSISFHVDDCDDEVEEIPQMLLIEVEDTGIGITKENKGRLFKPFMQAQRRTGGTGLGLYALSKRMESLGGSCGVKDRSDGASGSCFWISIPFKPDETVVFGMQNGNMTSPESSFRIVSRKNSSPSIVSLMEGFMKQESGGMTELETVTTSSSNFNNSSNSFRVREVPNLKILLVDDSNLIQKTTSRALIKEGHQVEVAQHGAECLKILESSQLSPCVYAFDLILMDLQMPVMDGLEATRRIRALEKSVSRDTDDSGGGSGRGSGSVGPHIMIIGVTANTEGEARADCMESGMDGFMEKPLKMKHFHEYIMSESTTSMAPGGSRRM